VPLLKNPYTAQGFRRKESQTNRRTKESQKGKKAGRSGSRRKQRKNEEEKRRTKEEDLKADSHDLKLEFPFENELASKVLVRLLKYITS